MKTQPVHSRKRSIFQAIFVPLILIMFLQTALFYVTAVYGGVERSLNQNAADILQERLVNRKNELESRFNSNWADLTPYVSELGALYKQYQDEFGGQPLAGSYDARIAFLGDSADLLIRTLRSNQVNGVFLILNDESSNAGDTHEATDEKSGLCIRDLDSNSKYTGREDLVVERCPSAVADELGCSLDSWWEARYVFEKDKPENDGSFYYQPLQAAWENQGVDSKALAYFCGAHTISGNDQEVASYSVPLIDEDGYPYGVLGVELTVKYLASLLPSRELTDSAESCYLLGMYDAAQQTCTPIVASGALFSRFFTKGSVIDCTNTAPTGGFTLEGREKTALYGETANLQIYDNNNPFEQNQLVLMALVEQETLFSYGQHIRSLLLMMSLLSLLLGVVGIFLVSRRFAKPITALARRAENVEPRPGFSLGHLGIDEIDQLVDSIEKLNQNVSKETARTEFFSRMSHDMRTPMNAIIGFSSPALLEGADTALKDDYLAKIHSSGKYLLGLINEVLDMTKIESNSVDLRRAPVCAAGLFQSVLPMIGKLAEQKRVRFTAQADDQTAQWVLADAQHLNQIAMNLLSNAVKFTPSGGEVRLETGFTQVDAQTVLCRILVRDSGVGMSDKFQKKLYTPFQQENSTLEGTGLGLSITKKLVDLMGGSIRCTSKKGVGTAFEVQLPMELCAAPETVPAESQESSDAKASLMGKRVLLCEDHPLNAQIALRLLEKVGIEMHHAVNGQEGVDAFAKSTPGDYDAILMDIRMPVMDGLAAASAIRMLPRPDAAVIPIIAMTANAFESDAENSLAAGMNAHLSKPIEPEQLYETLHRLLDSRKS